MGAGRTSVHPFAAIDCQAAAIGLVLVGLEITAKDLGISQGEISWIPSALSLSGGSFLLLGGRLADIYGRKRMLKWSLVGFTIWALIASFATEKYNTLRCELS